MEGYEQTTLSQWMSWKEDIRRKLEETACNFVYIGYRLKQIRDSGMYDGAEDIFGFALKEYGLGKSTVSRFIAINEKYSEGGDSLELKEEFRGFSSSKLAEMLTLPEEDIPLITERTTVKEIRELKNFDRQQAGYDRTEEGGTALTALQKCITGYFRDKKDVLNGVVDAVSKNEDKRAAGLINPSGYGTYSRGLIYLFFYGYEQGIKYKQFGQDKIVQMGWHEFLMEIYGIFGDIYESGEEDVHSVYYSRGRTDASVATSQQEGAQKPGNTIAETPSGQEEEYEKEQEAGKAEDDREPDAGNGPHTAPEPCHNADGTGTGAGEGDSADREDHEDSGPAPVHPEEQPGDEQIEGQMDITQFPEYMPKTGNGAAKDMAAGSSTAGDVLKDKDTWTGPLVSQEGMEMHIKNQAEIINRDLYKMIKQCAGRDWDGLIETAGSIRTRAEAVRQMLEVYEQ